MEKAKREKAQAEALLFTHKAKNKPGIVLKTAIALTRGIDVGRGPLCFVVRAWGKDLASRLVMYDAENPSPKRSGRWPLTARAPIFSIAICLPPPVRIPSGSPAFRPSQSRKNKLPWRNAKSQRPP
ncbi:hypothetical protein [Desulfoluna spongiiphila]|nr:hypothetical protein [Desulfoluna spongiiphila]